MQHQQMYNDKGLPSRKQCVSSCSSNALTQPTAAQTIKPKSKVVLNIRKRKVLLLEPGNKKIPICDKYSDYSSLKLIPSEQRTCSDEGLEKFDGRSTLKKKANSTSVEMKELKKMISTLAQSHEELKSIINKIIIKDDEKKSEKSTPKRNTNNKNAGRMELTNKPLKITHEVNQSVYVCLYESKPLLNGSRQKQKRMSRALSINTEISRKPSRFNLATSDMVDSVRDFQELDRPDVQIRELVSRRFQAQGKDYSSFLQSLLQLDKQWLSSAQFEQLLKQAPFGLDQEQIQYIKTAVFPKQCYSLSLIGTEMRKFVQDMAPLCVKLHKTRVQQIKSLLRSKKQQLSQSLLRAASQPDRISLLSMDKILAKYRFEDFERDILLSKLCLTASGVSSLAFWLIFDEQWLATL